MLNQRLLHSLTLYLGGYFRQGSVSCYLATLVVVPDGICSHTGEKLWYKDVQTIGKTSRARRLLPEEYRKTFANKQIVCVEYQDITDADEREIFQVCHGLFFALFSQRGIIITLYRGFNLEWLSRHQVSLIFNFPNGQTLSTHFPFFNLKKNCKS